MEEKREHLRQIDVRQSDDVSRKRASNHMLEPEQSRRSLCLICGKIEKTSGTGSFYKIMEETIDCYGGKGETIVKKLTDILGFSFETKRKMLASTEICKKCLRTTTEVVRMEEQVKRNKEELVSNFFTTISKFKSKTSHGSQPDPADHHPPHHSPPITSPAAVPALFPMHQNVAGFPFPQGAAAAAPFLVQSMPFIHQSKHVPYGNGIVQFYPQPPTTQYSAIRHARDVTGYSHGKDKESDQAETGSVSMTSISRPCEDDEDEDEPACSPRPFDAQSYASTFSFRSTSSIRSKAEIKSFDQPISLEIEKDSSHKQEAEKRNYESNETSPRSQNSPISTSSPKSDSIQSDSPGPDNDKDDKEKMKPWKKRKINQEPEADPTKPDSEGDSSKPQSEGDQSPDCQQQLDQGANSDN